jgi:O-antigen/teichoic acid export membrane protein
VICLLAQPLASFYEEPLLAAILPVAGLTALIDGLRSTRSEVLTRRMQLGRLTVLALCTQVVNLIIIALLAWEMRSVWALVIGNLCASVLTVILSHTALPGQPNRFRIEREAFLTLFRYGKYIFLATIAGFLVSQGDRAILGKYISLTDLGIYNIAYFLASVPGLLGNVVSNRILFPLYAQLPTWENPDNRRKVAQARFLVSGVLFFGSAVLGLTGVWLIELLYDPRYHGAGPTLVLIVLGALPGIIVQSYISLLLAAGQSGRYALVSTSRAIANTGLMLWAIPHYGVAGVPLALFLSAVVTYPLVIGMIRPLNGWDPRHDAVFAGLAAALTVLLAWLHPEILTAFAEP